MGAPRHTLDDLAARALRPALYSLAGGIGTVGGLTVLTAAQIRRARRGGDVLRGEALRADGTVGESTHLTVWLGDSLAAGVGADTTTTTLPWEVAKRIPGGAGIRNLARSGARIRDVLADQLPAALDAIGEADEVTVLVSVGANDVSNLTRRDAYREGMATLCQALRDAGVERVVVISIPQVGDAMRLAQPLRSIAALRAWWMDLVLRDLAQAGLCTYASVRRPPVPVSRRDLHRYLASDRYHPSAAGYSVWADLIAPVVAGLHGAGEVAGAVTSAVVAPIEQSLRALDAGDTLGLEPADAA